MHTAHILTENIKKTDSPGWRLTTSIISTASSRTFFCETGIFKIASGPRGNEDWFVPLWTQFHHHCLCMKQV